MPETFASTFRDMPRSARMVRTRWPRCSRKPASGSGFSVMSLFASLPGQTNFAISPSIDISRRFQTFGFDECFDPRDDQAHTCPRRLFELFGVVDKYALDGEWHFENFRGVEDYAGNLEKLRFATRRDGLIDKFGRHRVLGRQEERSRKHNAERD